MSLTTQQPILPNCWDFFAELGGWLSQDDKDSSVAFVWVLKITRIAFFTSQHCSTVDPILVPCGQAACCFGMISLLFTCYQ